MPVSKPERLLRRLEWTVVRRLDGLLQGDYRTLFRGFGLDLADLREYQPWDDVRHIDWNVTARLQTPHVRQFQEEREACAWFLVDLTGSMSFGSGAVDKRALASEFVGTVARLLVRHGNRVGAMLFGGSIQAVIPPRGGRQQVLQLLQRIDACPAATQASETDLAELLHGAHRMVRRRSLLFLVSDFFSRPGWEAPLARLAQRHEVVAVRPVDPLEQAFPEVGLLLVEDAETGERVLVDAGDPRFLARFAEAAARRESQLRTALGRAGVDTLELSTDADLVDSLTAFVSARRRRAKGGGNAVRVA
ncbi:MAG TPA: DUF58 domain-containing protein [Quisquiliibacterium sp.]|nr:DUF58 domain-containing protein [Quisquiliibacterium sp.]